MSKFAQNMRQHREKQLILKAEKQRTAHLPPQFRTALRRQEETVDVAILISATERNIELRIQSQLDQLKNIRAIEKKVECKKQWLPDYQGYIDASLAQSPAQQNHVLMYLMVWAIDTGDFALASRIGQHAILNKMVMPDGYTRNVAEVLAEQTAEACIQNPTLAVQHATLLQDLAAMVFGEDLVHETHAKLYKAIGIALEESNPHESLAAYKNALRLNANSGVKTKITQLEKRLNHSTTESSHDKLSGSQADTTPVDTTPASTAPSEFTDTSDNSAPSGE